MGVLVSPQLNKLARKYAVGGKVGKVMHEWKHGTLHSGSKKGPVVRDRKQAIAIALSEKRKQLAGKYATGGAVAPSPSGWWGRLQKEISAFGPQVSPQGSPTSPQQPQPGGSLL
jgi:hypothetical protein